MIDSEQELQLLQNIENIPASETKLEEIKDAYELAKTEGDKELIQLRIEDIKWRIKRRPVFGFILIALLFLQNIAVFGWTFYQGQNLAKLETAFNFLITGTLVETALIVRIIVEWLFKEIDFSLYKDKSK
jgi:hypothetical protein